MAKAGYKNLVEYLNDNCYDLLVGAAARYVNSRWSDFKTDYIPAPNAPPEVEDCRITSLYTEVLENDDVYLFCNVSVSVIISGHIKGERKRDIDQDTCPLWLSMKLKAKFVEAFEGMKVVDCRLLDEKERFQMRTASTKNFVPYVDESDLEYHAEQFLTKYYPEALKTPTRLDLPTLVKRMGLKALRGNLKGGEFGRCYFADKKRKAKDGTVQIIKRGTIICDEEACFYRGIGSRSNTIVHECVHWEKHRKFFALLHLLNPSLSCITCTTLGADVPITEPSLAEEYKWMEWQANALAPRILMPAEMTKLKFEQLKAEEVSRGETDLALVYQRTIDRLAAFFDVTVTSVKIRLLELGIDYLKGIHDYIDNKPTKPYLYNASKIKPEQSFSASFKDAVASGSINLKLRECLEKRTIVYASGFFVINNKKYTYTDPETGRQELTDYALGHMDECCLVYDYQRKVKSPFNDRYYSMCFLCRRDGDDFYASIDSDDEHNIEVMERAKELCDERENIHNAQEWIKNMNGSFGEALRFLMEKLKYNNHRLMEDTKIDEHKIVKLLDGSSQPSKREVIRLCGGMCLHPIIAHHLIDRAGYKLLANDEDLFYEFLIQQCHAQGLAQWDVQLRDAERKDLLFMDKKKK